MVNIKNGQPKIFCLVFKGLELACSGASGRGTYGARIAGGSFDNTIKVWDAESGQEALTLKGHSESVNSVAYNLDGARIVSGSKAPSPATFTTGAFAMCLRNTWPSRDQ